MPSIGTHQLSRSSKRKVTLRLKRLSHNFSNSFGPNLCVTSVTKNNTAVVKQNINKDNSANVIPCPPIEDNHNEYCQNEAPTADNQYSLTQAQLVQSLGEWSELNKIHGTAINSLLRILRQHDCFKELPKDSRTVRKTPRQMTSYKVEPGRYCHFPLNQSIIRLYRLHSCSECVISVQINIDGLPISKSSSQQFWPVLGHIVELPSSSPFVIGIYFGLDKPTSSNSLLHLAIQDFVQFEEILIDNRRVKIRLHSLVCDAPARSYVLNVKGHAGYFACHKCNIEGEYYNRRMTFPGTCDTQRTNATFRQKVHEDFHLERDTEFLKLDFDLVSQVPLDYQHLICLGVVRKVFNLWVKGKSKFRLSARDIHILSQYIITLKYFFPIDFPRKPRSLQQLKNWKATEFRTFLLYVGPVVLKPILPEPYYIHFVCLHVAIRILCSETLQKVLVSYAGELLTYYVDQFSDLYGQEQLSYNIHNLRHLTADSLKFGKLDNFSTFKFENFLGKIKNYLKSGNKPLEQVHNRITESNIRQKQKNNSLKEKTREEFQIKPTQGDNACELVCGSIFLVESIFPNKNDIILHGRKLLNSAPLYQSPCSSELLGIRCFSQTSSLQYVKSSAFPNQFNDKRDVAVVLTSWLKDNDKCYWPPFWKINSKLTQALKKGTPPDPVTWALYDQVKVIGNRTFDSYEAAVSKLSVSEVRSELSSDEAVGRLRKRGLEKHPDSDSDSNEDNVSHRRSLVGRKKMPSVTTPPHPPSITFPMISNTGPSLVAVANLYENSNNEMDSSSKATVTKIGNWNVPDDSHGVMGVSSLTAVPVTPSAPQSRFRFPGSADRNIQVPATTTNIRSSVDFVGFSSSALDNEGDVNYQAHSSSMNINQGGSSTSLGMINTPPSRFSTGNSQDNLSSSSFRSNVSSRKSLARTPQFTIQNDREESDIFSAEFDVGLNAVSNIGNCKDMNERIKRIELNQGIIMEKLNLLLDMTRTYSLSQEVNPRRTSSTQFRLPITSMRDFKDLHNELKADRNLQLELVSILATKGGTSSNQITHNIMRSLMTDDLMTLFTMKGQTGKEGFQEYVYLDCICDAVRKQPKGSVSTDVEIRKAAEYWLKRAQQRINKRNPLPPTRNAVSTEDQDQ